MNKKKTLKAKLDKAIEKQNNQEEILKIKLDKAREAYHKKQDSFHDNWDIEKI